MPTRKNRTAPGTTKSTSTSATALASPTPRGAVTDPNHSIAGIQALPVFLASAGALTLDEQRLIVDQALNLIQDLYVHLPLKRAIHAIDPVQSLRLLVRQFAVMQKPMKERQFHNQMIGIFVSLRDLHTNYILPEYFASSIAFLPFYLEEFYEDQNSDSCQYVVSKIKKPFQDQQFVEGVLVKYWNGIPIHRAVELNAERNAGSNADARHARGLENMTVRPMAFSLPPDEEWVIIGYEAEGKDLEIRIPWQVWSPEQQNNVILSPPPDNAIARRFGIDFQTETVRRAKVQLFVPQVAQRAQMLKAAGTYGQAQHITGVDLSTTSSMPDVLKFKSVDTPSGKFGYLRIYSFSPPDENEDTDTFVDAFLNEVVRVLRLLPQTGLILDVRGNGGGIVMAGERLLQLFTPRQITPALFDFINSQATQKIVSTFDELQPWRRSIDQAVETGAAYSQGFSLTSTEEANSTGQVYQGPVVLITNALIYSTTDMFTAGFQDHKIGTILGTSGNTGAGGANVWDYASIQQALPKMFAALPRGTSMRIAVRRSTRIGDMTGVPLEDLGVIPDTLHKMTRNDVFNDNVDLIAHAASLLKGRTVYSLSASVRKVKGVPRIQVKSQKISRVDIYVSARPAFSLDIKNGSATADLPPLAASAKQLQLKGYNHDELVAAQTISV